MANRTDQVLARISHKGMGEAKILIVVEKYISGEILRNILEELECDVTGVCTSSQEALVRVKKNKPDLILTDIKLDNCDGIYLAQQLKLPADDTNICIYFTAYASDLILQRTMTIATAMGCNINKYSNDKNYTKFESSFYQYYGTNETKDFFKQFSVQPIKVLLVDDQQIVLWGLEKLIDSQPRMEVVGTATNIQDAKRLVVENQPDILMLNIYLDNIDCISHISDLSSNGNTRIMVFTETHNKEVIDRAVLSGARGVVHRNESMQTILRAIEKIHDGELWLDRITTGRVFLQNSRLREKISTDVNIDKITMLTRKECVILRVFSDGTGGEQNKQIAARLCMSEHTLRNHLTSIFSKLGIKNRFSLYTFAKQHFQQLESSVIESSSKH